VVALALASHFSHFDLPFTARLAPSHTGFGRSNAREARRSA
jgi:hypothetical protein